MDLQGWEEKMKKLCERCKNKPVKTGITLNRPDGTVELRLCDGCFKQIKQWLTILAPEREIK